MTVAPKIAGAVNTVTGAIKGNRCADLRNQCRAEGVLRHWPCNRWCCHRCKNFIDMFQNGFSVIKDILMGVGIALPLLGQSFLVLRHWLQAWWSRLSFAVANLVIVIKEHWTEIGTFLSGLWESIKNLAGTVWQAISDTIGDIVSGIATFLSGIWTSIATTASSIWTAISTTVRWHRAGHCRYNHEYLERICVGFRPAARSIPISI